MAGTNARHAASTRKTTCLATTIHQTKPTNTTINRRNKPGLCGSSTPVLPVPLAASAEVGDRHPTTPPSFRGVRGSAQTHNPKPPPQGRGAPPNPTTQATTVGARGPAQPTAAGVRPQPHNPKPPPQGRGAPPNPTTPNHHREGAGRPAQPHNPSHHRGGPGGSAPRVKIAGLRRRWAKHTKQQSPRGGGGI